jgi:hypothetical protein
MCVWVWDDVVWAEEEYGEGDGDRACQHVHRVVVLEGLKRRCAYVIHVCVVRGLAMVMGGHVGEHGVGLS